MANDSKATSKNDVIKQHVSKEKKDTISVGFLLPVTLRINRTDYLNLLWQSILTKPLWELRKTILRKGTSICIFVCHINKINTIVLKQNGVAATEMYGTKFSHVKYSGPLKAISSNLVIIVAAAP